MKGNRNILILGFLTALFILAALISESIYFSDFEYRFRTRKFNRVLNEKEKIMEECLKSMKPVLAMEDHHGSINENDLFSKAELNRITILEYIDNKLVYWSDNEFDVPTFINDSIFSGNLVFFQNGWFLPKTIKAGNERIVGLLRIRTEYSFENDIIKSGFEKDFKIPGSVGFSTDKSGSDFQVYNLNNDFLFSLAFPEIKVKTSFIFIPLLLWILSFIAVIIFILELAKLFVAKGKSMLAVVIALFSFFLIYVAFLITGKPHVLFQTELFSPYLFSYNYILPTLGHLLLLSILAAAFSNVFYNHFPLKALKSHNRGNDFLVIIALLIPGALLIILYNLIFNQLVSTSNINFETYRVVEISIFSVAGFTSAILLVLVPVLYLMKIFQAARNIRSGTILFSIIGSLFVIPAAYHNTPGTLIPLSLFYFIVTVSVWRFVQIKIGLFNMAVAFSFIYGIYSLYFITILSEEKTTDNLKIKAVSLSAENDPDAEHLLLDMWPVISKDTILKSMMQSDYFEDDVDKIERYLQENYFEGYWNNFNFNIIICRNDESLNVGPGNEIFENCHSFFDERIKMETNLPVHVADDPLTAVARGAGKIIENLNEYSKVLIRNRRY